MANPASRVVGLLVLVGFIVLVVILAKYILAVIVALILIAIVAGLLFYVRVRLALRRFQKSFAAQTRQAQEQAARSTAPRGDVLDAEFKVEDGTGR